MNKPIDFRKYATGSKPHYSSMVDTSIPLPDQVSEIVRCGCLFPNHDIQYRLVANYLILPSALMDIVPILFLCGKQGSGKSQVGILASKLHKSPIFSSASSFAAIRNALTNHRIKTYTIPKKNPDEMPEIISVEANIFLIWDDLDPSLLIEQKQLYRILKNGYNRSTSEIQISSEKVGNNLSFNCFSPKLISSVNNLTLDPRFREFKRRCLLIETKPLEELNQELRRVNPNHLNYSSRQLFDFSIYDWSGFYESFNSFWDDEELLKEYPKRLKEMSEMLKEPREGITANLQSVCCEMLAIGVLADIYNSTKEAIELFSEFCNLSNNTQKRNYQQLHSKLSEYVSNEKTQIDIFNKRFKSDLPYRIKVSMLNTFIESLIIGGDLLAKPSPNEIRDIMLELGWYLSYNEYVSNK
jgi:hypothetical protein